MSQATVIGQMRQELEINTPSLFDILHNSLILRTIAPYLPIYSLLQLSAANHEIRSLIRNTPGVFRHLDLRQVKKAQFYIKPIDNGGQVWRNVQLDENLSEDDFYSGPLRGAFNAIQRQDIWKDVQTLILDGLSVTSDLCHELINDPSYSVRILSIREVENLNQARLREALQYACRPTRPKNSPRLKALYVFGSKEVHPEMKPGLPDRESRGAISCRWNHESRQALTSSLERQGDSWWCKRGRVITRPVSQEWVNCMAACEGIVAFDAVLCRGPRPRTSPAFGRPLMMADNEPAVATHAVGGCDGCAKAPEGLVSEEHRPPQCLPLLTPLPIMASSVRAATCPSQPGQAFVPRCFDCLHERYCACCHRWWCESCFQLPGQGQHTDVNNFIVVDEDDGVANFAQILQSQDNTPKIKVRHGTCFQCSAARLAAQDDALVPP
ncbi:uncharacterized protein MAM_00566 [Metarhizium album ARSEF 1941]|uniref:Ubiquitin fusion degradation protein (Ufd1) n=1 Tax=Metarhizium album (strain ARSEF 1941) TaxID=1081103 RepID=A0A0B2X7S5_METAS|nr:uncharacterized protein MAM_00566 [Metarhizium album ARSEF 1941]KHO01565.1 hypothetical protein MAM_00566 [Metarhizium album ARSEF 1941]